MFCLQAPYNSVEFYFMNAQQNLPFDISNNGILTVQGSLLSPPAQNSYLVSKVCINTCMCTYNEVYEAMKELRKQTLVLNNCSLFYISVMEEKGPVLDFLFLS